MTTWLPALLAAILVAVEARRLLMGHWRRERWHALIARSVVLYVGIPDVYGYSVGMDLAFFVRSGWAQSSLPASMDHSAVVVKVNYATGKLWVAA